MMVGDGFVVGGGSRVDVETFVPRNFAKNGTDEDRLL